MVRILATVPRLRSSSIRTAVRVEPWARSRHAADTWTSAREVRATRSRPSGSMLDPGPQRLEGVDAPRQGDGAPPVGVRRHRDETAQVLLRLGSVWVARRVEDQDQAPAGEVGEPDVEAAELGRLAPSPELGEHALGVALHPLEPVVHVDLCGGAVRRRAVRVVPEGERVVLAGPPAQTRVPVGEARRQQHLEGPVHAARRQQDVDVTPAALAVGVQGLPGRDGRTLDVQAGDAGTAEQRPHLGVQELAPCS